MDLAMIFFAFQSTRAKFIKKIVYSLWLTGVLRIPYAEIEEPFTAYYDLTFKRSRIDFYGGKNVFSMKD